MVKQTNDHPTRVIRIMRADFNYHGSIPAWFDEYVTGMIKMGYNHNDIARHVLARINRGEI